MTERELIKKLNNLKNIKPDLEWKKNNREVLLSQIANTGSDVKMTAWQNFFMLSKNLFSVVYQPALVTLVLVLVLMGGLFYGNRLNVKPNNSLYIAKIISEKAMLSATFNQDDKNKLALKFTTNHARDIIDALSDPKFNTEVNKNEVAKLSSNFKNEIDQAKDNVIIKDEIKNTNINNEDGKVFSAELSKDGNGISLSHSSTTEIVNTGSSSTSEILDDAQKMFNDKDYSGALNKLDEINKILK